MKTTDYLKDIRQKSTEQLKAELKDLLKELMSLRFRAATSGVEAPHMFKQLRGKVSRIKTVLREKAVSGV